MPTKVEIVDDHLLFAEALRKVIEEIPGYEVVGIAVTGPQAISLTREKKPELILLDYHLPGFTADDLLPRLRDASPESRVIVLTSDTSQATLARSVRAGVVGYVTKDESFDEVVRALQAVSKGQSGLTEGQLGAAGAGTGDGDLTARELEIIELVAKGADTQAIADALVISRNTVRSHLDNIFAKLGAHSKLEAVTIAKARGLVR